jgi:predicted RNA-binding protein Jag
VETPDSAILIGIHGKNIETFQYLLSRMIERKLDSHIHVHLEVNDYMKQKEEKLYVFLESKITKIISTGEPIQLPNLTPYERKKAHGYIAEKQVI